MRTRLLPLGIPVLVFFATLLLAGYTSVLGTLHRQTWDWRLGMRPDAGWPEDVVMVPIDDAAMHAVGRWPWPREHIARLVDGVRALGPKTIVFDGIPSSPTDEEADRALEKALAGTIMPVGFTTAPTDNRSVKEILQELAMVPVEVPRGYEWYPLDRLLVPRARFAAVAGGLGHPNFWSDEDGLVRRVAPLAHVPGLEGALPSLGVVALLRHRGADPREIRIEGTELVLPTGKRFDYRSVEIPLDIVTDGVMPPAVRAKDVLDPAVDRATLRPLLEGKLAIIHIDSAIAPDELPTPLRTKTAGGLLQAYVIRTFDKGAQPREAPFLLAPGIALAAALLAARRLVRATPGVVLGSTAAAALVMVLAAIVAARANVFFNVVVPVAFLLSSGAALAGYASREHDRERKRLQALLKASFAQPRSDSVAEVAVAGAGGDDLPTDAPTTPTPPIPDAGSAPTGSGRKTGASALLTAGTALAQPVEVGHYLVERQLGKGGMGAIFLARDRDLDRVVAIKVLEASDKGAYLRFRREALAVARIVHPNVVQIYELGADAEAPYIVMEYVGGGTVADLLRSSAHVPTWIRSTKIIRGLARGLGAAHEKGIVHRDVKPSNLLLVDRDSDEAKIADFGIAKLSGTESLTREGSFVGTVGYLSPEQAMGMAVDARSDVYSLGVTWYRMLTGRPAFDGTTAQILRASVQQAVPDPRRINKTVPEPLSHLLLEMTSLDRADRPKDCVEVARRMDLILEDLRLTGPGIAS